MTRTWYTRPTDGDTKRQASIGQKFRQEIGRKHLIGGKWDLDTKITNHVSAYKHAGFLSKLIQLRVPQSSEVSTSKKRWSFCCSGFEQNYIFLKLEHLKVCFVTKKWIESFLRINLYIQNPNFCAFLWNRFSCIDPHLTTDIVCWRAEEERGDLKCALAHTKGRHSNPDNAVQPPPPFPCYMLDVFLSKYIKVFCSIHCKQLFFVLKCERIL